MQDLYEAISIQGRTKHVIPLLELVSQHDDKRNDYFTSLLASVSKTVKKGGEPRAGSSLLRRRGFDGQAALPMTAIVLTRTVHHCVLDLGGEDSCHAGLAELRISDLERLSALLPSLRFGIGHVLRHPTKRMLGMKAAPGHDVVEVSKGVSLLHASPRN
jgi:hypothetical protein